ncbi:MULTISPECIES: AsmA family protein [unclassified Pseudoxanthomonas]|uniref:AsmA family protein n=1 Tax=unclassified Pseudoxanthomonas TaxID=2645906 RepID=UPI003076F86F
MPLTPWRPSRKTLTAAAAVAVAVIVFIVLFDWNWFKAPVERRVSAATGREFRIGGDLDVDLGRVTTIRADALRFGNAPWSREATMASADHAEMDIELWSLIFRRETRIPEIRLTKPHLRLETGPDGKGNWVFGKQDGKGETVFRRLWIEDGRLEFLDAARRTDIDIQLDSAPPDRVGGAPPVDIEGRGHWTGSSFTLKGRAESPLELRNADQPYRIDLRAAAGPTQAHARGTLLDPLRLRDFDVKLMLTGQNLEHLYPLIGIAMPPTPPYRLDGRFTRDGDTWHYDGFTGEVGDSDLGGSASITVGRDRPLLKANLVSKRLDFDDLAGFVGATPREDDSNRSEGEAQQDARDEANARVLPRTPYDLGKLRAMDADVRWKANRINAPRLPIDDMDAHLKLDAGVLRLQPLNFGVAGGDLRSNILMDARGQVIRTRAQIAARRINLGKLFPDAELTRNAIGLIGGDIAIVGNGNSVAQILGSADGDIALGMGQGQISNLLMELAGIDIAEALKFMVTKDRTIPVRCAFGDFAVKDGVMDARTLAFDSTDTIIVGKGQINLKNETLDLELRPRPKDRSLLALRSPLVVGGTFKDPSFRPDLKRLGLRGATALALGSIAPPAALLATLELGPGKDAQCGGKYAK